jgi:hypothetical protein
MKLNNKVVVTSSIIMNVVMLTALVYISKMITAPDYTAAPLIVLLSKPEGATVTHATYGQVVPAAPMN